VFFAAKLYKTEVLLLCKLYFVPYVIVGVNITLLIITALRSVSIFKNYLD